MELCEQCKLGVNASINNGCLKEDKSDSEVRTDEKELKSLE